MKARTEAEMAKLFPSRTIKTRGGCLEWTGPRGRMDYGLVIYGKGTSEYRRWMAHRFAWFLKHGSVSDDLCVLHRCDNPPCVNVDHLFLGTRTDNARDKVEKGRQSHHAFLGETHPMHKLTERDVLEIRRVAGTATAAVMGEKYGVDRSTIKRVVNGKTWGHVKP